MKRMPGVPGYQCDAATLSALLTGCPPQAKCLHVSFESCSIWRGVIRHCAHFTDEETGVQGGDVPHSKFMQKSRGCRQDSGPACSPRAHVHGLESSGCVLLGQVGVVEVPISQFFLFAFLSF